MKLFNAYYSIARKETIRIMRIWAQTFLPSVISIFLYFLIFGKMMGDRIGLMQGVPYITYIAPGLIMMTIVTNSYGNVSSSFFAAKFQGFIEEMLVAPMPIWIILAGYLTGGVFRGLIVGLLVAIISLFFTSLYINNLLLIFVVVIITSVLFSLGGLLNGMCAKKFDDISIIPTFVLTPLIYLGGIFYSIKLLPPFWQGVSTINPMVYIVNLFRYSMLGISDIPVRTSLLFLIIMTIILAIVCYLLLKRGFGISKN